MASTAVFWHVSCWQSLTGANLLVAFAPGYLILAIVRVVVALGHGIFWSIDDDCDIDNAPRGSGDGKRGAPLPIDAATSLTSGNEHCDAGVSVLTVAATS